MQDGATDVQCKPPQGLLALVLLALGAAAPQAAAAQGRAHVHGVAALSIVVHGTSVEVVLEAPLHALLGFERAPRTPAEREAVRALAARLRQPQTLFMPSASARCSLTGVDLASPVLPPDLLGASGAGAAPGPAASPADGHADLDASFRWRCDAPAELAGMEVTLLQAFAGLRTLKVQIAGPRGQSAAQLSGTARSLRW